MISHAQLERAQQRFSEIPDPFDRWKSYCSISEHLDWKPGADPLSPELADLEVDHESFLSLALDNGIDESLLDQIRTLNPCERFYVSRFVWEMSEDF